MENAAFRKLSAEIEAFFLGGEATTLYVRSGSGGTFEENMQSLAAARNILHTDVLPVLKANPDDLAVHFYLGLAAGALPRWAAEFGNSLREFSTWLLRGQMVHCELAS